MCQKEIWKTADARLFSGGKRRSLQQLIQHMRSNILTGVAASILDRKEKRKEKWLRLEDGKKQFRKTRKFQRTRNWGRFRAGGRAENIMRLRRTLLNSRGGGWGRVERGGKARTDSNARPTGKGMG